MKYYIDCEFDGHCGAHLSTAIVREDEWSIYIEIDVKAQDPWAVKKCSSYFR